MSRWSLAEGKEQWRLLQGDTGLVARWQDLRAQSLRRAPAVLGEGPVG